jgi:hypothetical protein
MVTGSTTLSDEPFTKDVHNVVHVGRRRFPGWTPEQSRPNRTVVQRFPHAQAADRLKLPRLRALLAGNEANLTNNIVEPCTGLHPFPVEHPTLGYTRVCPLGPPGLSHPG